MAKLADLERGMNVVIRFAGDSITKTETLFDVGKSTVSTVMATYIRQRHHIPSTIMTKSQR